MITSVVDTTVVLHVFRKDPLARRWVDRSRGSVAITAVSWLEVIYGAPGKSGQAVSKAIMSQFELIFLTAADQEWAMQQMERYRLSNGVSINDCLIASVVHRLQVPLYTHNLKHMRVLLGDTLQQQPYA